MTEIAVNEEPKPDVLIIGKTDLSESEADLIHTLGFLVGISGNDLHTTKAKGTAAAAAAGYRKSGMQPHMHSANLRDIEARTIVLLDEAFEAKLTKVYPEWLTKDWEVFDDEDRLGTFVSAMATWLVAERHLDIT